MTAALSALPDFSMHSLHCHPSGQNLAVQGIAAAAALTPSGALALRYRVQGDLAGLLLPAPLPAPSASTATDGLWQHTCCEAFIAAVDQPEYYEFNFSPSGQWAVYRFGKYRERVLDFIAPVAPQLTFSRQADGFLLEVRLPRELLPVVPQFALSLSMVLEGREGATRTPQSATKTFWALAHCAAQPDFHLRQSFVLTMDGPSA
jgi:hypothetical protein